MFGNIDIWEIDWEFSIVLDNLLELEYEKLQNFILEKFVFGLVMLCCGDGEGVSFSVVFVVIICESFFLGLEVLQKVM